MISSRESKGSLIRHCTEATLKPATGLCKGPQLPLPDTWHQGWCIRTHDTSKEHERTFEIWFSKTLPWWVFSNPYKLYSWVFSICGHDLRDFSVGIVCLHDTGAKTHTDKATYHWGTSAAAGLLPQVWTPARFKLCYSFINVHMCVGWGGAYGGPKWTSGVFLHDAQLDVYWGRFSLNRSSPIPPSPAGHSATEIRIFEFMVNFSTFSQSLHSYSYGACCETCDIIPALRRLR